MDAYDARVTSLGPERCYRGVRALASRESGGGDGPADRTDPARRGWRLGTTPSAGATRRLGDASAVWAAVWSTAVVWRRGWVLGLIWGVIGFVVGAAVGVPALTRSRAR
jgi:hypothetical protein